ncbi:hypothetical protein B0H34DRAFT_783778 [Crassisporium funariophilum]|nr:hypothetical protein B0H34DRAFT_783778 [Crassisporium funariophilum]
MAAALGHYRPKSFTKEEDMESLLRARGKQTIIPSHAHPTEDKVQRNIKASLESIMDEIQATINGNVLHTMVIFDELATEKRIHWDPKTNHFLGFVDEEKVHYTGKATVGALGILCKNNCIYPGRPVLLGIVLLASDGRIRQGSSFILLTFKHQLLPQLLIYSILKPLNFLNLYVGNNDLTSDKDWKHVFKRFQNLLLCQFWVTPDIIMDHLKLNGLSADHIRSLFNPDNQQDMKMAFDMLKDIWLLPRTSTLAAQEALWILGKLLFHLVFPYLCVDLLLSEKIEHSSAAAHSALALYKLARKDFLLTNLYIDVMIMIKNVLFCVAKAKVDNPNGEFWVILLAPHCLKLPAPLHDLTEISKSADHIKPALWRGNIEVKDVSLQTLWNCGCCLVEEDCKTIKPILQGLEENISVDILALFGTLLFNSQISSIYKDCVSLF